MSRKYLQVLVLILLAGICGGDAAAQRRYTGEKNSLPPPPPPVNLSGGNCYKAHQLSFAERMQHYPFSQAAKITVASFSDKRTIQVPADSIALCGCDEDPYSSVPVPLNPRGDNSVLKEEIILDPDRLNSLTSILYDYDYREDAVQMMHEHGCYYPHNAILFYSKDNNVFAFIELCFSCTGKRTSYERDKDKISWCEGKIDLLKTFFSHAGIQTGTTIIPMLPGSVSDPGLNTPR